MECKDMRGVWNLIGCEDGKDGRLCLYGGYDDGHWGYLLLWSKEDETWWDMVVNTSVLLWCCDVKVLVSDLLDGGYKTLAKKIMELEGMSEDEINEPCF